MKTHAFSGASRQPVRNRSIPSHYLVLSIDAAISLRYSSCSLRLASLPSFSFSFRLQQLKFPIHKICLLPLRVPSFFQLLLHHFRLSFYVFIVRFPSILHLHLFFVLHCAHLSLDSNVPFILPYIFRFFPFLRFSILLFFYFFFLLLLLY